MEIITTFNRKIEIEDSFDQEGDIEIVIEGYFDYISLNQVKELRDHLNKVLGEEL